MQSFGVGLQVNCGYIKTQGLVFLNRDSMLLDWDSWFFLQNESHNSQDSQ